MLPDKIVAQEDSSSDWVTSSCEMEWQITNEWAFAGIDTFKFQPIGKYTPLKTEVEYAYGQEQLERLLYRIGDLICKESINKKGVLAVELEIGINGKINSNHVAHSFDKELDFKVIKELEITNGKWRAATGLNGASVNSFLMIFWKIDTRKWTMPNR